MYALTLELLAVLTRGFYLFVEIRGQIVDRDSLGAFLTRLHPYDRQRDFASENLAKKFLDCEMAEVITAYPFDRNDRHAVLRHEKEHGVHAQ